jgi:asparagine synthase (glutamine-hydrolysing)
MTRIAGFARRTPEIPPPVSVEAAAAALDPSGRERSQALSLGAATLITTARPQAARRDDGVIVVIDGTIYNRDELAGGADDAARIAALYASHGFVGALSRINGDFAIALYDQRAQTLWLGRDRVGAKPLFYVDRGDWLAFGSRPRVLLAIEGVARTPDRRFVATFAGSHYRTFDNEPTRSPWEAIAQLPAAHALEWRDGRARLHRYWSMQEQPDFDEPEAQLAERYRGLLLDAVARRVAVADRPVFSLSGGMDSSSVLACAVARTGEKLPAISTVYEDPTYDESAEIRSMLDATVSHWETVTLGTPDVFPLVEQMIDVNDEPVATATWLSHFELCRAAAARGFGTIFGGLGGDELNAGEYEYFFYFFADLRAAGDEARLAHETSKWIEYHDHPIFKKSFAVMEDGLRQLVDFAQPGRCLPPRARLLRYAHTVNPDYFDLRSYAPVMDHPFTSYLKNRTYQDIYRETAPCCLRAADRNSSAFGLDVVWPFFDHRLLELMFRVPARLKIRDGVTKYLLRESMRSILPEETRTRIKKTGWNAPAHVWFAGGVGDALHDLVGSQRFRERGIYDVAAVRRLVDEHFAIVTEGLPVDNHMMFLWQLVNLELWLRWNERS